MSAQRLTRVESRIQTRERLLDAARHLFAQHGFTGASIDAISAEAGYSKGAFYSNFDTKEAIFLELLSRHMASEAAQLSEIVKEDKSAGEIMDLLDAWFDQRNCDPDWVFLTIELQLQARRSPTFAKQYDAHFAKHNQKLGALIERLFTRAGKLTPIPAHELAAALLAMGHGLALQRTTVSEHSSSAGPALKTILRSLLSAALNSETAATSASVKRASRPQQ